jgi:hypothetical protein
VRLVLLVPVLALLALSRSAAADDAADCIEASEAAQSLRDRHILIEARDKFGACSRDVCPRAVRADCLAQRADVDAAVPTVVFRAKDAHGDDVVDVQVFCDGKELTSKLDGTALFVNPGPHTFRFEPKGGTSFDRTLVVGEGEKNRVVVVEQAPTSQPAPAAVPPVLVPQTPTPPAETGGRRLSIPGLVVASIGVAATIPMAALWVAGTSDVNQMRQSCAPPHGLGCSSSRVSSDRTELEVGDAFLGVAVVGVVTGVTLLWTRAAHRSESPSAPPTALRFDAGPTRRGAVVSASASF